MELTNLDCIKNLKRDLVSCLDFNLRDLTPDEKGAIKHKEQEVFWHIIKCISSEDKELIDKHVRIRDKYFKDYAIFQAENVRDSFYYDGQKTNMVAEKDTSFIKKEFPTFCREYKLFYILKFPHKIKVDTSSKECEKYIPKMRAFFYLSRMVAKEMERFN